MLDWKSKIGKDTEQVGHSGEWGGQAMSPARPNLIRPWEQGGGNEVTRPLAPHTTE